MKRSEVKKTVLVIIGLILALFTFAQTDIQVTIDEVECDKGQLIFRLFASEEGFPSAGDKAFRQGTLGAQEGKITYTFKDVPPGFYAISIAHDENGNNEVDRNFVGMPKERVGVSNQFKFGRPNFDRSRFEVVSDKTEMSVTIQFIN